VKGGAISVEERGTEERERGGKRERFVGYRRLLRVLVRTAVENIWSDGGKARQGKARQGKARQGKARQGKARQGKKRCRTCPKMKHTTE
jgi:hypothetical protein